ncbi:MAG: type IX secretion system outer membrane channel protein PorV [Bacteroidetes bacterium]|nr:type IX secretion system outer membrane channel protein PorV [Bacteroidota bacterium]MCW5894197.1 type IX secretion system outer membrane channel protein PorV [Bacteroidota bacterium]
MKAIFKASFVCALTFVLGMPVPQAAQAQGESAVPFLLIAPNSRAAGIGETGTGSVDDASAVFWNPGALAFMDGQEVTLTHANWLPQFGLSDLFYEYLNYRNRIDDIGGTIGVSITYLNLGEFIRTNSAGLEEGKFKAYEFAVTAGYSTKIFDDLGLGFNARFIRSSLSPLGTAEEQGSGIANTVSFDIAMMWRPFDLGVDWLDNMLSMGFNLSNLGPKVTYVDAAQADPLPTNLRVGLGYKVFEDEYNSLTYSVDASRLLVRRRPEIKDSLGNIIQAASVDPLPKSLFTAWGDGSGLKKINLSMGAEYWYGSPRLIAIRVGHFFEDPSFGNRNFWTFGAGLRYDIFGFDFSYISAAEGHPLSDTIRFSLLIGWGASTAVNVPQ